MGITSICVEVVSLRDMWKGPLIIEGFKTTQNAELALSLGFRYLYVSYQGGRQPDQEVAGMFKFPEFPQLPEAKEP